MAITFQASESIVRSIVNQLRKQEYVHPDAVFNHRADHDLRREITYRDEDFLYMLSKTSQEEKFIDDALECLISNHVVLEKSDYNKQAFHEFRQEIKKKFKGTWTSITPVMERLMYMLTSVHRPKRMVEFGCYWGNTLAWFIGPGISKYKQFELEKVYAVDVNAEMINKAIDNFSKIEGTDCIEFLAEDARVTIDKISEPIDFLYLEAKSDESPELYLELLQKIYPKLSPGAWVIAHDIYDKVGKSDLVNYVRWVRDKSNFQESLAFDIDNYGMELSIK
ncbi:O-methyltransferase [candidate division CSSED10-310 bacterium]|uniref:O-methyltransferase n=1 Tax=candidate division CSSED10-310 bacterium TaxID=2855610 RepID=A0ABV6Z358_UNCC1